MMSNSYLGIFPNSPLRQSGLGVQLLLIALMSSFMFFLGAVCAALLNRCVWANAMDKIRIQQLIQSFVMFVLSPLVLACFLRRTDQSPLNYLSQTKLVPLIPFVIVLLAILVSIPFINWFAVFNESFFPPDELSKSLEHLSRQLLQTDHISVFWLNVLVMALIPAVGEEMYFRGMLQNTFSLHVNPHLAVWLSAVVFSAIHCQLDAFFPRLLLGAFLGYLLLWSHSLWLPIFAHFINNVSIVAFSFFFPTGIAGFQLDTIGLHQPVVLFLSVVLTAASVLFLLHYFRQSRDNGRVNL